MTAETFDVCLRATATWMRAVDSIISVQQQQQQQQGLVDSVATPIPTAMALTRPPGHHATVDMSNGFGHFNFAAAAAAYFQSTSTAYSKIVILDWDVHFGQGVADILLSSKGRAFSSDSSSIRYASIHQSSAFPYLGTKRERTRHETNENSVLTIPMTPDTTWTCGYQQYFQNALDFLLPQDDVDDDDGGGDRWVPDLVIVCAGYDALDSDELASVSLNANDFGKMTRTLLDKIRQTSNTTGLLLGLEGGYQLSRMAGGGNLQQAVVETVKVLFEDDR